MRDVQDPLAHARTGARRRTVYSSGSSSDSEDAAVVPPKKLPLAGARHGRDASDGDT